jgi:hypothetical protein
MHPQAKTIAVQNNRCDCLQLAVSRASKLLERSSMGSHQPWPIAHRYASAAPANAELPAESALFVPQETHARAARQRSAPSTEPPNRRSRKPPGTGTTAAPTIGSARPSPCRQLACDAAPNNALASPPSDRAVFFPLSTSPVSISEMNYILENCYFPALQRQELEAHSCVNIGGHELANKLLATSCLVNAVPGLLRQTRPPPTPSATSARRGAGLVIRSDAVCSRVSLSWDRLRGSQVLSRIA